MSHVGHTKVNVMYNVRIGRYDSNGEWVITQIYGSSGNYTYAQKIADAYNRKYQCDDAYVAKL